VGKVSRQILAEEAAKWSREQRAAQEVLMENIKSGGNGLTVRTVISARKKTTYIIQNGKFFLSTRSLPVFMSLRKSLKHMPPCITVAEYYLKNI
jgi:hypothetical protein